MSSVQGVQVADHLVNVDQAGDEAVAWCSCGWTSPPLYSRRRAREAGGDHLRALVR